MILDTISNPDSRIHTPPNSLTIIPVKFLHSNKQDHQTPLFNLFEITQKSHSEDLPNSDKCIDLSRRFHERLLCAHSIPCFPFVRPPIGACGNFLSACHAIVGTILEDQRSDL
jgi:hypothetical protein